MVPDRKTTVMAGYVRISKEDAEKQAESESIQNQKALLVEYARQQGWEIYDIYSDEDYSGADSLRPQFNRLIADAEKGRFQVVVCKSQSRFTRDMEAVEQFIHHKFLLWGIRFISITDNGDTWVKGNKKARQIHGLINEWYLEDLSENVRTVLDYKRKSGQFIGAFPAYGYKKDPENRGHLVPDPVAAQVVRKIFTLYLEGMGKTQIAKWLNAQGIPSPAAYKAEQYEHYAQSGESGASQLWSRTAVGRILGERMYTGDLVQGKKKKVSYKSKHTVSVPRPDWIVVENTHIPLIGRDTFEKVQQIRNQRTRPSTGSGTPHALGGKVRCMACGSAMSKYQTSYKDNTNCYLRCKLYGMDRSQCTSHSVRLDQLEQLIAQRLRVYVDSIPDREGILEKHRQEPAPKDREVAREIKALQSEKNRRKAALRQLYLDRVEGIITPSQFEAFSRDYQIEVDQQEKRIAALQEMTAQRNQESGRREKMEHILSVTDLTRSLVRHFVEQVEVGEKDPEQGIQPIRVHWKF